MTARLPANGRFAARRTRRDFLIVLGGVTGTSLVAACGQSAPPATKPAETKPAGGKPSDAAPATSKPAASAPTSAPAAAAKSAAPAASTTSSGELRIAVGIHFPAATDANRDGFTHLFWGVGETLTRLTREQKLEPWVAESYTNVDPTTWKVTIRKGVTFWDGTPLTAQEVVESLKRNFETQPAANRFISKDTQLSVEGDSTVVFKTPRPHGDLPFSLASQFFVISKPGPDGVSIETGPFRITRFVKDQEMTFEAFSGHWAGPPALAKISLKAVADANARALGLQSGDLDMLWGLPPELVKGFGPDIETLVQPSVRQHLVILNTNRPPFSDRDLREATSLAIDRAQLNAVGLDGLGVPLTGMFPKNAGFDVVDIQGTDVEKAKQLLDKAGWTMGSDGVRVKDGKRLSFTLYSYPGRAELTPIGVGIQGQLRPLGYEINVQSVQDITSQLKDGDFDASMYSINTAVTGDPQYMFAATVVNGAVNNFMGYTNPQLETIFEQLRAEPDPAQRQVISRQAQDLLRTEVPNIYLVAAPIIAAYRKGKVQNFAIHPNDIYLIDRQIAVT